MKIRRQYSFDDPKLAFAEAEKLIQRAFEVNSVELNFEYLGLTQVPESICRLTKLSSLVLHGNKLTSLPESIGLLTQLRIINLSQNELKALPNSLSELQQLQRLFLGNNELRTFPEFLTKLKKLQVLAFHENRLTMVPESIGKLTNLKLLFLDVNRLVSLPESIGELKHLQQLDISSNQMTRLPSSLCRLQSLKTLYLHENKGLNLPAELLGPTWLEVESEKAVPSKPAEILYYYFRTKRPLNEAKLILLGRGEVGKTCVVNRLVHDRFTSTAMTRGITITQWPVRVGRDVVRLHVWDFGGQEIQHATHQFFLTERSLYLVVLNGRAGAEDEDAEYWLKFVRTFGGSSPTIVVMNKSKVHPFQLNRRALKEKYPFIRSFVETDCKTKINNGIRELKHEIEMALLQMEHVKADFPAGWFQIKERLADMKEPFISFTEYRKICAQLGENDSFAQERLAGFLNALGIALNFREDLQLRDETVLNPHWITEGVYEVITSTQLAKQKGELRLSDLASVLPKKTYPVRMHGFLIELMRKFELCFSYHDDPNEQRYLVPELLGKEEPQLREPFPPSDCLNFRYDYRLMPEGLLPRFITRTHTMSEPAERWRTGVVLRWEGCRALVKADKQERQVLVRVLGESEKRRRLLAVIRENFDQIHTEMREFKPTEWITLESNLEAWTSIQELKVFESQKLAVIPKTVGQEVVTVEVSKELDKSDVPGARKKDADRFANQSPFKLFISYAHEDEKWRAKLAPNLALLEREGLIEVWSDLKIIPGMKWDDEIKQKLNEADIYLFLMSTDLLVSKYVQDFELPIARMRHEAKTAHIVPVVVRASSWTRYLGDIQGLPKAGKPVKEWADKDQAFHDVEMGMRQIIAEIRKKP